MSDVQPELFAWLGIFVVIIGSVLLARYSIRRFFKIYRLNDYVSGGAFGGRHHEDQGPADLFEPPNIDSSRLF